MSASTPLPHLGQVLASASALFSALGLSLRSVVLEASNGTRIEIPLPAGEQLELPGRLYSPLEVEIVTALGAGDGGWFRIVDLAATLKREPNTGFRSVVANLAEAGVLDSSHQGVRLARVDPIDRPDRSG